jgi:hypothetical protein
MGRAGPAVGGPDPALAGDHRGGCVDGAGRGGLQAGSDEGGTPARGGEGGSKGGTTVVAQGGRVWGRAGAILFLIYMKSNSNCVATWIDNFS